MATNFYSIIHYVPDPALDECLNIGVVAYGADGVRSRFLRSWRRVSMFGGEDIGFLKAFARRVETATAEANRLPGVDAAQMLDAPSIAAMAEGWMNSIQFSEPRSSLLELDELVLVMGRRALKEPTRKRREYRDRRAAVSAARKALRRELATFDLESMIEEKLTIAGRFDEHRFDIAVMNGSVLMAAQAISFEGPHTRDLGREIDATAWTLEDVSKAPEAARPKELAVVVLPPRSGGSKSYDSAKAVFGGLGVEIVEEAHVEPWSRSLASNVVAAR